jgi:peptidoglycan/xylan/chitin deacetylase (PgdA/CDA1 family)
VPVLAYHPSFSAEWTVEAFRQQLQTIHDLKLRPISFRALRWYVENGGAPRGCVVLSIDDVGAAKACCDREGKLAGPYANFWLHMYPELARYGFQAVLSVVTGGIPEEADGWDWRKIRFLHQLGHELASHSVSHRYEMVGRNGTLSKEEAVREFSESKATIADKCGAEPIAYVWPFNAVQFKAEAQALYPVLVTYGEGGAVQTRAQLSAVPRYHAELHQGQEFTDLMLPFEADADRRHLRPRTRRAEITYIVQAGDVLERIALRHNTTVAAIVEANRYRYPALKSGLIFPKMQLLIPTGKRFYGGP